LIVVIDSETVGDVLDFGDLDNLLKLTAARAAAVQETVGILAQILRGQREQAAALEKVSEALADLISCSSRVEGISTAMASYLSSRDGDDLRKLAQALDAIDDELAPRGEIHVHVEQKGGTQIGEVKAKASRDIFLAGGDVKKGSG
jgi:hypothetical protein